MASLPLLYTELADCFHLFTAPSEYVEEARDFTAAIHAAVEGGAAKTLLELGGTGRATARIFASFPGITRATGDEKLGLNNYHV